MTLTRKLSLRRNDAERDGERTKSLFRSRSRSRSTLLNFGSVPVAQSVRGRGCHARRNEEGRERMCKNENEGNAERARPKLIHIPLQCFLLYNSASLVVIHLSD